MESDPFRTYMHGARSTENGVHELVSRGMVPSDVVVAHSPSGTKYSVQNYSYPYREPQCSV